MPWELNEGKRPATGAAYCVLIPRELSMPAAADHPTGYGPAPEMGPQPCEWLPECLSITPILTPPPLQQKTARL